MTLTPVPSPDVPLMVNVDLVAFLENLLELAKTGEIRCACIALVHADGDTSDRWSIGPRSRVAPIIGAVELMKARLIQKYGGTDEEHG
jgi:hypothetical protein